MLIFASALSVISMQEPFIFSINKCECSWESKYIFVCKLQTANLKQEKHFSHFLLREEGKNEHLLSVHYMSPTSENESI